MTIDPKAARYFGLEFRHFLTFCRCGLGLVDPVRGPENQDILVKIIKGRKYLITYLQASLPTRVQSNEIGLMVCM